LENLRALLLAAGLGSRLKHLTNLLPKCLMPIQGRPLLEYWLWTLDSVDVKDVLINLHYRAEDVKYFLSRPNLRGRIKYVYEPNLLGTAATLRANASYFRNKTALVIHADNWCHCNFKDFLEYHFKFRPKHCLITMMTFTTSSPKDCGIVEVDDDGCVKNFFEKSESFHGNKANAAVYLIEPDVLDWIERNPLVTDISTEVLPNFIGKISTWHNYQIHRDIGSFEALRAAQKDFVPDIVFINDDWSIHFSKHPIHQLI
jgi:mannose-1-phosphate guanylyltransferase